MILQVFFAHQIEREQKSKTIFNLNRDTQNSKFTHWFPTQVVVWLWSFHGILNQAVATKQR